MNAPTASRANKPSRFRLKLLVTMMLVVAAITLAGLSIAERKLTTAVEQEMEREFLAQLTVWHGVQEMRHDALAELGRTLVGKPRIHAALEDNALDLLYVSARDELRAVMSPGNSEPAPAVSARKALFYRFLDVDGTVIPSHGETGIGELGPGELAQIVLGALPRTQQLGYIVHHDAQASERIDEIIAVPIISTETDETISALVLGFTPVDLSERNAAMGIQNGIWLGGRLYMPAVGDAMELELGAALSREGGSESNGSGRLAVRIGETPYMLFHKLLNPASLYPPAQEVCIFPLTSLTHRKSQLRMNILGAGALMMLLGLVSSHYASARLSAPVEELAVESEENLARRNVAETALEQTHEELVRSVRFSADASHQLKTPVTILRAGLDELLSAENISPAMREELSLLVHQTYRLTGIIEDLLLLSRMDAGRLKLQCDPVDLSHLIDTALDDLGVHSGSQDTVVDANYPPAIMILGEKRYTSLILQNLFENARKYNIPGGRIRVRIGEDDSMIRLFIGNTGKTIPPQAHAHIFDRFHRGDAGENIAGHGLGLNIARELALLHGGDLRLVTSAAGWTEFEVIFHRASSHDAPESSVA